MADTRLGPMQTRVLKVLGRIDWDAPPTPAEMAPVVYLAWRDLFRAKPTTEAEAVASCLARLARRGLAERLGTAASGARTWTITTKGEAALLRQEARADV